MSVTWGKHQWLMLPLGLLGPFLAEMAASSAARVANVALQRVGQDDVLILYCVS
jgi:hypothetical protein